MSQQTCLRLYLFELSSEDEADEIIDELCEVLTKRGFNEDGNDKPSALIVARPEDCPTGTENYEAAILGLIEGAPAVFFPGVEPEARSSENRDPRIDPRPGDQIQERDRRVSMPRTIAEVDDDFVWTKGPPRTRIRRSNLRRYFVYAPRGESS